MPTPPGFIPDSVPAIAAAPAGFVPDAVPPSSLRASMRERIAAKFGLPAQANSAEVMQALTKSERARTAANAQFLPALGGMIGGAVGSVPGAAFGGAAGEGVRQLAL